MSEPRLAVGLVVVAASLAFLIVLAEVGLRLAGIGSPNFYYVNDAVGLSLLPGAEGEYTKEGGAYVRINADGLRDEDHATAKPDGTYRVAVIGDSHAEAMHVPMAEAFWAVMERRLAACPAHAGRTVEAINFGVSGYGTAQELLTLRHKAWAYDPDLVLLLFTPANDVWDNSRALLGDGLRPYFVYRDGELVLDESFRQSTAFKLRTSFVGQAHYWLLSRSRLWQQTFRAVTGLRQPAAAGQAEDAGFDELGLDAQVYRPPETAEWREAWRVTEGLVTLMRDEVEARGKRFFVAVASTAAQINPDAAARARFAEKLGVDDLLHPNERIVALGARAGFPVLDLAPILRREAEGAGRCLHGFANAQACGGHWNAEGNRRAGELIADALCQAAAAD